MKNLVLAVALTTFAFSSCSEAKKETTTETGTQQEAMSTEDSTPAAGKVVVEAPDYKAEAQAVKPQIGQVLDSYLKLKEALTEADAAQAKTLAQSVLDAAKQVDVSALPEEPQKFANEKLTEIRESATNIAGGADIKAQRNHLELLSEATFALTKAFDATDQKLYYQYCPMANNNEGAYWLSATKEIRNPYYGKSMLTCGSNEEVYN